MSRSGAKVESREHPLHDGDDHHPQHSAQADTGNNSLHGEACRLDRLYFFVVHRPPDAPCEARYNQRLSGPLPDQGLGPAKPQEIKV